MGQKGLRNRRKWWHIKEHRVKKGKCAHYKKSLKREKHKWTLSETLSWVVRFVFLLFVLPFCEGMYYSSYHRSDEGCEQDEGERRLKRHETESYGGRDREGNY